MVNCLMSINIHVQLHVRNHIYVVKVLVKNLYVIGQVLIVDSGWLIIFKMLKGIEGLLIMLNIQIEIK